MNTGVALSLPERRAGAIDAHMSVEPMQTKQFDVESHSNLIEELGEDIPPKRFEMACGIPGTHAMIPKGAA